MKYLQKLKIHAVTLIGVMMLSGCNVTPEMFEEKQVNPVGQVLSQTAVENAFNEYLSVSHVLGKSDKIFVLNELATRALESGDIYPGTMKSIVTELSSHYDKTRSQPHLEALIYLGVEQNWFAKPEWSTHRKLPSAINRICSSDPDISYGTGLLESLRASGERSLAKSCAHYIQGDLEQSIVHYLEAQTRNVRYASKTGEMFIEPLSDSASLIVWLNAKQKLEKATGISIGSQKTNNVYITIANSK